MKTNKFKEGDLVRYKSGLGKTHWAVIKHIDGNPFLAYRIGDCTIYDKFSGKFELTVVAPRSTIAQELKL